MNLYTNYECQQTNITYKIVKYEKVLLLHKTLRKIHVISIFIGTFNSAEHKYLTVKVLLGINNLSDCTQ